MVRLRQGLSVRFNKSPEYLEPFFHLLMYGFVAVQVKSSFRSADGPGAVTEYSHQDKALPIILLVAGYSMMDRATGTLVVRAWRSERPIKLP
jgi:hypothetical protein